MSLNVLYKTCRPLIFALLASVLLQMEKAQAAVTLNAACEGQSETEIAGESADKSFIVASLSKIFTTQWALEIIGYNYRYETTVYLEPINSTTVNLHIRGGGDPTWGRERLHHLVSELDRLGVRKINQLTFDENFILSWRAQATVIEKVKYYYDFTDLAGAETKIPTTDDVMKSLKAHFVPRKKEYAITVAKAKAAHVDMVSALKISAPKSVAFVESTGFTPSSTAQAIRLPSLPLFQILKLMNVTSNNYLADMLFLQMGGASAFSNFVKTTTLQKHAEQIDMQNGSGYPIKTGETKFYNQASCASIVSALRLIDQHMVAHGYNLQYVFPVASTDPSTLDKYELPANIMIAKTGTVNPTITLAGMVQTSEGPLYFSRLMKTESPQDWPQARALIKTYLLELIETHATPLLSVSTLPVFWVESGPSSTVQPH